ncbi:hypothetical protein [Streptomyces mirabilis]|uniref:hypothetical protein n=1 Tax=Streptomyces mirabilis TaxID=68239 RepID=UPI0033D42222
MAPTTRPAPVKRRTTSSPKKKAAAPAAALEDGDYELVELSSTVEEEERVGLFSIDGTVYTIPKVVPQGIALEFLRMAREYGENIAAQRLLERLLGADSYTALEQCPSLDDVKMQRIVDMAQKIAFGKAEVKGGKAD